MERTSVERGALGALISLAQTDAEKAVAAIDSSMVGSVDFEHPVLGELFEALHSRVAARLPVEYFGVCEKLSTGAKDAAASLWADTDPPSTAQQRLSLVRDAGVRRRLRAALQSRARALADATVPADETAAAVRQEVESIVAANTGTASLGASVFEALDHMELVEQGKVKPAIPTGIEPLDAATGGLQRTLTIVGALPGVGKSALFATMAGNLARAGVKVGYFSLEDERRSLTMRLMARAARIPVFVLATRPLTAAQKGRLDAVVSDLYRETERIVVYDTPLSTVGQIVSAARSMVATNGAQAIFVDHLGEIKIERTDRHDLDVIEVLQELRSISKRYDVPVVVAAHLKRRAGLDTSTEPELTDFAFSSGIERMARVAIGLSIGEKRGDAAVINATILKQTNGKAGLTIPLRFIAPAGVVANDGFADSFRPAQEAAASMTAFEVEQ